PRVAVGASDGTVLVPEVVERDAGFLEAVDDTHVRPAHDLEEVGCAKSRRGRRDRLGGRARAVVGRGGLSGRGHGLVLSCAPPWCVVTSGCAGRWARAFSVVDLR